MKKKALFSFWRWVRRIAHQFPTFNSQTSVSVCPQSESVSTFCAEKSLVESSQKTFYGQDLHDDLEAFLFSAYAFRYNVLTDQVEFRPSHSAHQNMDFVLLNKRMLNTMVIEARKAGVNCWDKDVDRLLKSTFVENFHPFYAYMEHLPKWDGVDRIVPLAERVDTGAVWKDGFRRWLLALTAQWMGKPMRCANTLTPVLISPKQGYAKSTFCRLLMPPELADYYLDKLDLNAKANVELKLGQFGLINLDEFDRYSGTALATLKNLVQLQKLTVKKAYASYFMQLGRIASFIATSNQMELLKDPTGSRRFLCVEVKHSIDCSPVDHQQLFAQLKELVQQGERLWMVPEEELTLQQHNLLFSRLRPEQEVFLRLYHVPQEGEEVSMLTTTEIHRALCKFNPSAMRGVSVYQLGRTLSAMGLKRVHTMYGNKYCCAAVG